MPARRRAAETAVGIFGRRGARPKGPGIKPPRRQARRGGGDPRFRLRAGPANVACSCAAAANSPGRRGRRAVDAARGDARPRLIVPRRRRAPVRAGGAARTAFTSTSAKPARGPRWISALKTALVWPVGRVARDDARPSLRALGPRATVALAGG